jgi:hypothetical protein
MAGWKEYIEVRRMKQALKLKAEEVADKNLLRFVQLFQGDFVISGIEQS